MSKSKSKKQNATQEQSPAPEGTVGLQTQATAPAATPLRNSDKVRAQIEVCIREGKTYEDSKKDVVEWAVANLGQKRALARRYVKENWVRVTKALAKAEEAQKAAMAKAQQEATQEATQEMAEA